MKCLKKRQLIGKKRAKFITSICEAMYTFKSMPTKEEYDHVALEMLKKWSFLGSKNGHVRNYFQIHIPVVLIIH